MTCEASMVFLRKQLQFSCNSRAWQVICIPESRLGQLDECIRGISIWSWFSASIERTFRENDGERRSLH